MKVKTAYNLLKEIQIMIKKHNFCDTAESEDEILDPIEETPSFSIEKWRIAQEGKLIGSFSIEEIEEMILNRELENTEKCYVWKPGMKNWELITENSTFASLLKDRIPPPLPKS